MSHPETKLLGVLVFQRPCLVVLTALAAAGLSAAETRTSPEEAEVELYFRSAGLHLWREGTHFTSLALGVAIDANDREIFPDQGGNA